MSAKLLGRQGATGDQLNELYPRSRAARAMSATLGVVPANVQYGNIGRLELRNFCFDI